jgi:hypothetical protein
MTTQTRFVGVFLFFVMVFSQFFDMHSEFHAGIYTSTNHIPFLIPALLSGIIIVTSGYLLLPVYGLVGLLLIRFFVQASFNFWYATSLSLRLLKWPFGTYLKDVTVNGSRFVLHKVKNGLFSELKLENR